MGFRHSRDLPFQVKLVVYKNRIRLREFFVDYDKLRTGYVTEGQFMSGLTSAGLKLAAREMKALADKYKDPENPQQKVHYRYVLRPEFAEKDHRPSRRCTTDSSENGTLLGL